MCQEKIEKNDNEKRYPCSGTLQSAETGQQVVFQGFLDENDNLLLEAKCVSGVLKERKIQEQEVQQFLSVVRSTLKKCKYLKQFPSPEQQEKWNVSPSCEIRQNHDLIGYVEDMDYLLDCEYIYKEIFKSPIKTVNPMEIFFLSPDKFAYFSELFQLGVLKPYEKNSKESFCRIRDLDKWFIRVSNELINIDISKLQEFC